MGVGDKTQTFRRNESEGSQIMNQALMTKNDAVQTKNRHREDIRCQLLRLESLIQCLHCCIVQYCN
jgi:hypothetical protein